MSSLARMCWVGAGLLVVACGAWADDTGGCVISPENPTVVLALLGVTVGAVRWVRARAARRGASASSAEL